MRPDTVDTLARPAVPTFTVELVTTTLQSPSHTPTSTLPDFVRTSRRAARSTRMLPLTVATFTDPTTPRTSTLPDTLPNTRSVPSGHCTSMGLLDLEQRTRR